LTPRRSPQPSQTLEETLNITVESTPTNGGCGIKIADSKSPIKLSRQSTPCRSVNSKTYQDDGDELEFQFDEEMNEKVESGSNKIEFMNMTPGRFSKQLKDEESDDSEEE
jgi:hypothetical protein